MDTEVLVDDRIDDGRQLVAELLRSGFDVTVAFWARTSEDGLWTLYLASPAVDPAKPGGAYRAAYESLGRVPGLAITPAEIHMINDVSPIARDAISVRGRYAGRMPTQFHGDRLGNLSVVEAYIYPAFPSRHGPTSAEERRLKKDVVQVERPEDFLLTQEEKAAVVQLMAQGVNSQQAEEWVRKKREKQHPRSPIPAGTVVRAWTAAHWGDKPEDDPNPLLMVEAPDGARGLTFKDDTEPVGTRPKETGV